MTADQIATLNSQLTIAREKLAALTIQRDALVARDDNRHWTETDTAIGSGIRRKPNAKADAARYARYDREAKVFAEFDAADKRVTLLERRLAVAIGEHDRIKLTRDDILGAAIVLIKNDRWRRVIRVNRDTVTVGTGYSWTERFPFDMVIDTRAVAS